MTSPYAGKVYRMDRTSIAKVFGTPLCDQLIEVDKIGNYILDSQAQCFQGVDNLSTLSQPIDFVQHPHHQGSYLYNSHKIGLHLYGEDKSTVCYSFSHPRPGYFGATVAFDGFTSFQIGNVRETETSDELTYDLLHFFNEKGADSVSLYPGGIEMFNSTVSISKALFDRLVSTGLFVEETAQKADDHAGQVYNPFTNTWSYGFC
jgi:hypothetical protein